MNKIDQTKITPQIHDKIKEVNDEAGYRTYLEVPEMIRIVCEVIEANYNIIPMKREDIVFLDNLYCFKEQKFANSGLGKCTACGELCDSVDFYKNHYARVLI